LSRRRCGPWATSAGSTVSRGDDSRCGAHGTALRTLQYESTVSLVDPPNHAVSGLCSGKRDTQRDTTRIPAGATAPAGRHPTLVAADALQFDTIVTTKGGER